jgi:hypothetical protein
MTVFTRAGDNVASFRRPFFDATIARNANNCARVMALTCTSPSALQRWLSRMSRTVRYLRFCKPEFGEILQKRRCFSGCARLRGEYGSECRTGGGNYRFGLQVWCWRPKELRRRCAARKKLSVVERTRRKRCTQSRKSLFREFPVCSSVRQLGVFATTFSTNTEVVEKLALLNAHTRHERRP